MTAGWVVGQIVLVGGIVSYLQRRRMSRCAALTTAVGDRGVVYPRGQWAVVLWNEFTPPEDLLRDLARALRTDAIWLSFQKQVDAFEFQRWSQGALERRLAFGCYEQERTWEHNEDRLEPWEAEAWHGHRLVVGSDEPSIDGRAAAAVAAAAYALPGWE